MKIIYKTKKFVMPTCPKCKNILGGNGSKILPYYCECGEWKPKDAYDFKGEYEILNQ